MDQDQTILITGTSKGIGRYLAEYYLSKGFRVIGCSRTAVTLQSHYYQHFHLDIANENDIRAMFEEVRRRYNRLDILINNAGIASMNHFLLTPLKTVWDVFSTNVIGTFLCCREAARLMQKKHYGRIVNFTTVAVPLKLQGETMYASSKAAVISLTQILAKELGDYGITVNAIGPTPVRTDLIDSVPKDKLEELIRRQAIHRFGEFRDIVNVIDFFIRPESDFVTGQVLFLGGI